jgi:hypothetical protein
MSFDWSDYLELAKLLGHDPGGLKFEEAALRSAISRATGHSASREFLRNRGVTAIKREDRDVINHQGSHE